MATESNLTIDHVTVPVPPSIKAGDSFSITVNVTATQEAFDEGVPYSLLLYVNGLKAGLLGGEPLALAGTLQDATWTTPSTVIPFLQTAGPSPDLYTITAVLTQGPTGAIFQDVHTISSWIVVHP
jgi:hypothetical protein